ncbi:hypothetical protein SNEBB_008413 [Seison nebaliae]|nr:hypothetical protein SNEBB_008413 [Seison nebaliae]
MLSTFINSLKHVNRCAQLQQMIRSVQSAQPPKMLSDILVDDIESSKSSLGFNDVTNSDKSKSWMKDENETKLKFDTMELKDPDEALNVDDYFHLNDSFSVYDMFKARVHFGHVKGMRSPWMKPYIFGSRQDIDIIDLDKSKLLLLKALNFLAHIVYRKGIILFVSKHIQTTTLIEKMAMRVEEYSQCRQWRDGVLTNSYVQFNNTVVRLPDCIVFLNCNDIFGDEHKGVKDAAKMLIPTIGVVDTNYNPSLITYPIPGNDDSYQSIYFFCNLFEETVRRAKYVRQLFHKKQLEEEKKREKISNI